MDKKARIIRAIVSSGIAFLFVLISYLYLLSQSQNAWFGAVGTGVYLLQYLVLYFFIAYLLPNWFISPIFGIINAILLYNLQINRSTSFIFPWDWMLSLGILIFAFANFVISVIFIIIIVFTNRKNEPGA